MGGSDGNLCRWIKRSNEGRDEKAGGKWNSREPVDRCRLKLYRASREPPIEKPRHSLRKMGRGLEFAESSGDSEDDDGG